MQSVLLVASFAIFESPIFESPYISTFYTHQMCGMYVGSDVEEPSALICVHAVAQCFFTTVSPAHDPKGSYKFQ
jgi:hypothetical protein